MGDYASTYVSTLIWLENGEYVKSNLNVQLGGLKNSSYLDAVSHLPIVADLCIGYGWA